MNIQIYWSEIGRGLGVAEGVEEVLVEVAEGVDEHQRDPLQLLLRQPGVDPPGQRPRQVLGRGPPVDRPQ
eukprot:451003-Rhodomonas_salina.1